MQVIQIFWLKSLALLKIVQCSSFVGWESITSFFYDINTSNSFQVENNYFHCLLVVLLSNHQEMFVNIFPITVYKFDIVPFFC